MTDRESRLRDAIAKVRENRPELPANPKAWTETTDPFAMLTRFMAEKTAEDFKAFQSEIRRWIYGIIAAILIASIVSITR